MIDIQGKPWVAINEFLIPPTFRRRDNEIGGVQSIRLFLSNLVQVPLENMLNIKNLLNLSALFSLVFVCGQSALADVIPSCEELAQALHATTIVTGAGLALGAAVISAGVWALRRLKK